MTEVARRWFLQTASVAGLTPRSAKAGWWRDNETSSDNTLDVLKDFKFTDQNGDAVSISALAQSLTSKKTPFTVSFAWPGCSSVHTDMHRTLTGLENVAPDLVHVVIDSNPVLDPQYDKNIADNIERKQQEYASLIKELKSVGNMHSKIIILYPDPAKLKEIQESLILVPPPDPRGIVQVGLYGRDGKKIGFKSTESNTPEAIVGGWRDALARGRGI